MILVDANVFMYVAGRPHPNKVPSADLVLRIASGNVDAAIDAEILQEILHRYRGEWLAQGRALYDYVRQTVTTVIPISSEIVDGARLLMDAHPLLSARDAVHAAVCMQHGLSAICSYDSVFDQVGVTRVLPSEIK